MKLLVILDKMTTFIVVILMTLFLVLFGTFCVLVSLFVEELIG